MTYSKTVTEYAKLYSKSDRTIKRYRKEGLPLDDPEAMAAHFANEGDTGGDSKGDKVPIPRPRGTGPVGLKANIERFRHAEIDAYAAWQAALDVEDEAEAARRQRQWVDISEQLWKVEVSTPDVLEANRQTVSLSDLKATLGNLFGNLRVSLDVLPRRIAKSCEGKDVHSIREIIQRETDDIINRLYNCKFLREDGGDSAGDTGNQ
jgi:hypothetical protein